MSFRDLWPSRGAGGLGLLILAARLAHAQGAAVAAPEIDPAVEKPLTQFVAMESAREASIHFLHFVLDRQMTYIHPDGSIAKPPMPTHLEGWIDTATGNLRYENRPQVSEWTDGTAPFYVQDMTLIRDGAMEYYVEPTSDLTNLQGHRWRTDGPPSTSMLQDDGSQDANWALTTAGSVLEALHGQKFAGFAPSFRAHWTTRNGTKVVEIAEEFPNFKGGPGVSQRQVYRLDPAHDLALCSYEESFPLRDKTDRPLIMYDVERFAKSGAGFFYPEVYRSHVGATGKEKYDSTTQESVTTITTYEPLNALPDHITEPPKPKGTEYVGENNEVVQPPEMRVTVLDEKTKKPVADAPLIVRIGDVSGRDLTLQTDAKGQSTISLPKEEVTFLTLACDQAPYVRQGVWWRKYGNPLRLPTQYEMDLETGSPISGRIQGESGEPVVDAQVDVSIFAPRDSVAAFSNHYDLFDRMAKTNADGEWRLDCFPESLDGLCVRVTHPDYQPTTDMGTSDYTIVSPQPLSSLRDGTSVIVLKRGNRLAGKILGADGKPVAGARLIVGKDMWGSNLSKAETDENGHFVFKGLASGNTFLTIQAKGLKPKILPMTLPLAQSMEPIQLEKGRVLRLHVVDAQGKPCAGFEVRPDTWNKLRTLDSSGTTDANGDFTWDSAPDEPVTFSIGGNVAKREYLSDLPLQAVDTVLTVTMKPALHLSAQVVDGKTGQPIAKFHVTPGLIFARSPDPAWDSTNARNAVNGAFDWSTDRMGPSFVFKVEADGYETLVSDPYKTTQSDYTAVFKLVGK